MNKTKYSEDRYNEITQKYFALIDGHLSELLEGKIDTMYKLKDIAKKLHVSHSHLIAIINETSGHHPCFFYEKKIIAKSEEMLLCTKLSVAEIARRLTYDPSNFGKFFKKMTGITPKNYRDNQKTKSYDT